MLSLNLKDEVLYPICPLAFRYSGPYCVVLAHDAATKTVVIWGSESTGAGAYQIPWINWRKSQPEVDQQRATAITLRNYFANYSGYTAHNHQGVQIPGSSKAEILSNMWTYTDTSSRVAFVDFDHGVGSTSYSQAPGEFHFMFEDNIGTMGSGTPEEGVYDMDVYYKTDEGKTIFAFINTCLSASLTNPFTGEPWQQWGTYGARGLPFAFTHGRTVEDKSSTPGFNIESHMSDDAYFDPDDGSQVYIGFPYGSASLSQNIPYPSGSRYSIWVDRFFYHALYYDMSVNQALDHASMLQWGMWWSNPYVPLRDFVSHWDGFPDAEHSSMAVYGNGRIQLKTFGDNFDDGNYNGWTVTQGGWTVTSQKLRSQQSTTSLIRTNQQFTTNRHVRASVRTITAGSNSWDVAWLIGKYVDPSNQVYALLHKNGNVELSIVKNGVQLVYTASTPLSTYNTNTIDLDIVGNKAYVWVRGDLYLTVTHDWLDDFGGYAALYARASTAEFDDITVASVGSY